ncbi:MAG TPA: tetratricopeptide repeat protein [Terracidiphilus sp.]|nr:tetratricopeptide repeat protein [Terracidiphilus sp.]
MRRTVILAVIAGLLSSSALPQENASQNPSQSAVGEATQTKSPFQVAEDLAARGRIEQAMAQLDQLAAQTPEPKGVERLRGIIFYQQEKLPEAASAFAKAMEQDPDDRESIEMRGVSLFRLGRPAEALPFLEKAHAAIESANIDPQYVLGLCYVDVQRYDDARHAFATLYGFPPDSAEAFLLAARLFLRREYLAQAADQVNRALQINPAIPLAHQLLGEIALAKGDSHAAIAELEAERKIDPLDGLLYERLGDAYLRSGQYTDAQTALDRAVLLEPSSTAPYILLGETFLKLKQPIPALHYLARAAKMDPSNYITHNLMGQAYKATGQVAEANREFQMVVDLQHQQEPKPAGK